MSIRCLIGWHKWKPIPGTIKQIGWYDEEAELKCERCGTEAYGTRMIS